MDDSKIEYSLSEDDSEEYEQDSSKASYESDSSEEERYESKYNDASSSDEDSDISDDDSKKSNGAINGRKFKKIFQIEDSDDDEDIKIDNVKSSHEKKGKEKIYESKFDDSSFSNEENDICENSQVDYKNNVDDDEKSDENSRIKPKNIFNIESDSDDDIVAVKFNKEKKVTDFQAFRENNASSSTSKALHIENNSIAEEIEDSFDSPVSNEKTNNISSSDDNHLLPILNYNGNKTSKQSTLDMFVGNTDLKAENTLETQFLVNEQKIESSEAEYNAAKNKVENTRTEILKFKNIVMSLDLDTLPDGGEKFKNKIALLEETLSKEEAVLNSMIVKKVETYQHVKHIPTWHNLESVAASVQPRTFGKQALATLNEQKTLTMERLEQLHGSLKNCPSASTQVDDPKGLLVELMPHQKHSLAWLTWRENQKPSGGILADDMGLGKTLTMIALILKCLVDEREKTDSSSEDSDTEDNKVKYQGGTLILCPASLINHWEHEILKKVRKGKLSQALFHGTKRENKAKNLAKYNIVITTYSVANVENKKNGILHRIKWRRIILDEAHQIRNHKSLTAIAVCELSAKSRWALTGTPVHNKELDLYSLLKFLRCTPFDDLHVWKRWVANKSTGGQERLNTVISSLLLRRTKEQLVADGSLANLPEREWTLIEVTLDKSEMDLYQRVLMLSRTLFSQFLHQRAEKNQDQLQLALTNATNYDPNGEYYKMHKKLVKLNRVKEVKQHEILVLLLRLRQLCCHPFLIKSTLNADENVEIERTDEMDIINQLNNLNINENDENASNNLPKECVSISEAFSTIMNPQNPIFDKNRISSKITEVLKVIKEKVIPANDKCVIVSQWTSLLDLIAVILKKEKIEFQKLDGRIPVPNRMAIVDALNNPSSTVKALLLSLTAGGVGLNLVGANHLLLLDLHWNPQLEMQAQDRIYRFGQNKPVFIYKFMSLDTIEQKVQQLQERKMNLANAMLSGTKVQQSKLTLDDLKMLFNM